MAGIVRYEFRSFPWSVAAGGSEGGVELAIAAASLVFSILAAAGVGYTIRVMRRMEKKADARWAEERQTALTMRVFPHKPDAIVTFHNRGEHALLDVRAGVRISGQPIIYGPAPFDLAPGAHVRLTIRIPPDSIVHAFTDSGAPNYVVDATFSDGAGRQWMAETYYDNPDDAPTLTQMPCLAGRAQTGGGARLS